MADNEALLTAKQAAAYLGIHEDTLRKWAKDGSLACGRVGQRGDFRFRRPDLDARIGLTPLTPNTPERDGVGSRANASPGGEGEPPIA